MFASYAFYYPQVQGRPMAPTQNAHGNPREDVRVPFYFKRKIRALNYKISPGVIPTDSR